MRNPLNSLFTKDEQKAVLFLLGFLLLGSILHVFGYQNLMAKSRKPEKDSLEVAVKNDFIVKIDVRTATIEELISLQGIGQKRAGDIIAYREKHPFTSVNQIMNVSGIGVKTYLKMYSNLVVFGDSTAVEREEAGKNSKTSKSKSTKVKPKNELKTLVNLNTATIKDLCTLEGIGEVKAKAIIDYRNENGAFASVEDITKVKGIGEKTLQKNIHRLTIGR